MSIVSNRRRSNIRGERRNFACYLGSSVAARLRTIVAAITDHADIRDGHYPGGRRVHGEWRIPRALNGGGLEASRAVDAFGSRGIVGET